MNLQLPILCVLSALLIGCSSDSADLADSDPTGDQLEDPVSTPEPLVEQSAILDASNYETLLIASLDMLRSDFYSPAIALLSLAAQSWEPNQDAVIGTTLHDCQGGGTINRDVSEAPLSVNSLPQYNLVSELTVTDCVIDGLVLNGIVGLNWNQSSPAQLGGTSYDSVYAFNNFSMIQPDSSETITGTFSENIDIAGPGDGYTRSYDTVRYERVDAQGSVEVADSSYTQAFGHYIAHSDTSNGVLHLFKERGVATVSIKSLGMSNATLRIDPEFIYANEESATSTLHTASLASGVAELAMTNGTSLVVTVMATGDNTVTYTLTDIAGQQTTIEREWIAPAICRPDDQFNYQSC